MADKRKQLNLRLDTELESAIGRLQQATPAVIKPTPTQVIRAAIFQALRRLDKTEHQARKK